MIKTIVKTRVIAPLIALVPVTILAKITGINFFIPYYHVISDDKLEHVQHLYNYKGIKQFIEDMEWLLKNYTPVNLYDLIDCLQRGKSLPERAFLLTFDDGFREMSEVVAPILIAKGVPATFFLTSAFIDNSVLGYHQKMSLVLDRIRTGISDAERVQVVGILGTYGLASSDLASSILSVQYRQRDIVDMIGELLEVRFEDFLAKKKPYLTTDQIKQLIKNGFTIGAHSIDHPLYALLSLEEQLHQTVESITFIRKSFNLDYGAFAFPHTDRNVSEEFYVKLAKSGLVDVTFGTGGMINDSHPSHFQRIGMEKPLVSARQTLSLHYAKKILSLLSG
jgi:peptidoglycan/xylan/chitin deacetylase (PgdA/CDA1 family)